MVHQLNLALKDADQTRLNIAIYSDVMQARHAGRSLAWLLGVPLADQVEHGLVKPASAKSAPVIPAWVIGSHNTRVRNRPGYCLELAPSPDFRSLFSGEARHRWCAWVEFRAKGYWRLHQPVILETTRLQKRITPERRAFSDIVAVRLTTENPDNTELNEDKGKGPRVDTNASLGQMGLVLKGQDKPCLLAIHADPVWARQVGRAIADFVRVSFEDQLPPTSDGSFNHEGTVRRVAFAQSQSSGCDPG
jgi:hypothetical protein